MANQDTRLAHYITPCPGDDCHEPECSRHGDDLFCENCKRWVTDESDDCVAADPASHITYSITGLENQNEGTRRRATYWRVVYGPFADYDTAERFWLAFCVGKKPLIKDAQLIALRQPNLDAWWNVSPGTPPPAEGGTR